MQLTALQEITVNGEKVAEGQTFTVASPKAAMGMLKRRQAQPAEREPVAVPTIEAVPAEERKEAKRQIAEDQRFGTARTDAEVEADAKKRKR